MSAVLEASGVISSITGALVVSSITELLIDLPIVLISATDAQLTDGTNNSTTTNLPVSQEARQRYLDELQSETTRTMIPALVFLVVIAVTGLVSNTLVIVVYTRKPQWTGTGTLIITIAVLDLLANIIAIPGDIYEMLHKWDFESAILCSAKLYITVFTTISSGIILVAVAVTRYRKVCRPQEWQITPRRAKVISITVASLAALFSTPYVIIMGRQTVKTPRSDIVGYDCSTSDDYVGTVFPLAIYMFYLFLYVTCSATLTVLYILIGVTAWKHRETYGLSASMPTQSSPRETTYRHDSNAKDQPLNQNDSNCTKCRNPYNKNTNTSFTQNIVIQNTSHAVEIKLKRVPVDNKVNEAPVQYNVPVFTDRIGVRTPGLVEFFVNLHRSKSGNANPASHEKSQYNTDSGHKIPKAISFGEDTSTSGVRMIGSYNSNIKMKRIKSKLGDIVSYGKYTDRCSDAFLTRQNKLGAVKTNDSTVNTFHSKELSVITDSAYDKEIINLNSVDHNRHLPQSIETASNEILNEPGPWPMFKWLDVIYFPHNEHTFDSNGVQRETSLSFRLPLNKKLFPQTEWLRTCVIEAMERPDEMTESKSGDNCPLHSSAVDFISSSPWSGQCDDNAIPDTSSTDLDKNLSRMRFRESMLRWSILTITSQQHTTVRRGVRRTTVMLFIISSFYILGYLPHLALQITSFLSPSVFENMSMTRRSLLGIFSHTFYLNSAVNPIVYSLCHGNFRRECYKVLKCSSKNSV